MLVAAKTCISGGRTRMAGYARGDRILAVSEREGVLEGSRLPGCGGVTGCTICASLARVRVFAFVAGITVLGRADEHTIDMTSAAGGIDMRAGEREG